MDLNAGQRAADRRADEAKVVNHWQEDLKYANKETTFKRALNTGILGFTRTLSDFYASALTNIGKGRGVIEDATKAFLASKAVNEGGRAVKFGLKKYQALLQKRSEVDSVVDNILGRNMAYANTGAVRKLMAANAAAREGFGLPAMYGAPAMLTPTNRLGGALKIGTTALSMASSIYSLGGLGSTDGGPLSWFFGGDASDRKLKDNIKQVGISPKGYKIYEFSYKGADRRFRGVMAQDVVKKNPMAVGISSVNYINFLTVDYDQIDVDMELV
jgi:hypothetical protein